MSSGSSKAEKRATASPSPSSSPSGEKDIYVHHYRLDKTIGQGTYGKVKLAYDSRTGEKVPSISYIYG
jgi:serine/threonine protein kinase